jgi:hypothetical protein
MKRAHLRQTNKLRDYENAGGINDPRNAVYISKGGRLFRAWGLDDQKTELVNCNTGVSVVVNDEQIPTMVREGVLTEIIVPVGGQHWIGVPGDETLDVPSVANTLVGKYAKGRVTTAPKPALEILPIVDIDGPPLHSRAADLTGKYARPISNLSVPPKVTIEEAARMVKEFKKTEAGKILDGLVGKYARKK